MGRERKIRAEICSALLGGLHVSSGDSRHEWRLSRIGTSAVSQYLGSGTAADVRPLADPPGPPAWRGSEGPGPGSGTQSSRIQGTYVGSMEHLWIEYEIVELQGREPAAPTSRLTATLKASYSLLLHQHYFLEQILPLY